MTKNLEMICEDLREQIGKDFDLGHGDAKDLFKLVWDRMTAGPNSRDIETAINKVADHFDI